VGSATLRLSTGDARSLLLPRSLEKRVGWGMWVPSDDEQPLFLLMLPSR
jgi:hypothetical protein